jgi:hypothetical protein
MKNWDYELEQAKKEKEKFFRVKVVEIQKPNPKVRTNKDGTEIQEITPRCKSGTKKAAFAVKVKRMENSLVHNLSKRERLINSISHEIRLACKYDAISERQREALMSCVMSRNEASHKKFKAICNVQILRICSKGRTPEVNSKRSRVLTIRSSMNDLMNVRT